VFYRNIYKKWVISMKNIFLTGDKGIGKSTLLFKIVNKIDCSIGGFYEKKIVYRDEIKFDMVSLYDGRCNNIIGKINKHKLPEIYKDIFETVGVEILTNSLNYRDCIVMDEIGFFEIQAENFKNKVFEILDSSKLVIGVLKKCNNEFLNTIKNRKDVVIFDVTLSNRDYIFDEIIDYLKRLNIPLKGKRTFNIDRLKAKEYVKDLKLDINDYPKKF